MLIKRNIAMMPFKMHMPLWSDGGGEPMLRELSVLLFQELVHQERVRKVADFLRFASLLGVPCCAVMLFNRRQEGHPACEKLCHLSIEVSFCKSWS